MQRIIHILQITGVERISEYSNLPSEDGYDNEMPDSVPKDWPTTGAISFLNVSLYYSMNDPPVLKNLNFSIRSGEKVRFKII